jgi:hypothetical protein
VQRIEQAQKKNGPAFSLTLVARHALFLLHGFHFEAARPFGENILFFRRINKRRRAGTRWNWYYKTVAVAFLDRSQYQVHREVAMSVTERPGEVKPISGLTVICSAPVRFREVHQAYWKPPRPAWAV